MFQCAERVGPDDGLVLISARFIFFLMNVGVKYPYSICSWAKLTGTSRCRVREVTLLDVMTLMVAVLSMNRMGRLRSEWKTLLVRKLRKDLIFGTMWKTALTSASVESFVIKR